MTNDIFPKNVKRTADEGQEQLLAGYVLDSILIKRKPKDAVVLMGITEKIFSQNRNGTMCLDLLLMKMV